MGYSRKKQTETEGRGGGEGKGGVEGSSENMEFPGVLKK